jgi:hypothetical protein
MGGSALKVAPQINLDEFERRLRAAGAPAGAPEDPLDELARLVGVDGPAFNAADRSVSFAPKVEAPQSSQLHLPHIDEGLEDGQGFDGLRHEAHEAYPEAAPEFAEAPQLRGALEDEAPEDVNPHVAVPYARPLYPRGLAPQRATPAPRRSSRIPLTMGVLVGVGAIGLVGAWAIKGAPGLPRTPPVIMAADGPTKVQPPSEDTVASPSDSASILMKDQAGKPGPVRLVSSEEQPVDLQQQTKPQPVTRSLAPAAADTAPPAATPIPAAAAPISTTPTPAPAAAPLPAASSSAPVVALTTVGPTTAAPAAPAAFPEPKRVKTVSVRPDGSVISTGATTSASVATSANSVVADASASPAPADADAMPQPANPPVPRARPSFDSSVNNAAAQPATPKLDLPPKPSAKSTARVPIAKIDTTVASGASQSPEAPEPTALQFVPGLLEKAVKAVSGQPNAQVAAADPAAPAATAGGGSYAVQLAAPGTEQEAQSASTRLQAKFATELGGLQPSIRQADLNGRAIYRVRVGSLSKADAVALCQKLKASGGGAACFVAKN